MLGSKIKLSNRRGLAPTPLGFTHLDYVFEVNASTTGTVAGSITIGGLSPTGNPSSGTNISMVYRWGWNDVGAWLDFYSSGNVMVSATGVSGYGNSSLGEIILDCNTSPIGSVCAADGGADFAVANDGTGNLSGWAWSDVVGWISFCGHIPDDGVCDPDRADNDYQVWIDNATGYFHGWAWNDAVGWISFNCSDTADNCTTSSYSTQTSFYGPPEEATLTSSVFDTGADIDGASFNTVMWVGEQPIGTPSGNRVRFQLKSSNVDDANLRNEINFIGPGGTSGVGDYYSPSQPGDQAIINSSIRYLKTTDR